MTVCLDELHARIRDVNALMRSHAGDIELIDVKDTGQVTVRFRGKCRGCDLKPLTLAATVRPALLAVPGVTAVIAAGARISDEAAKRVAEALGPDDERTNWLQDFHKRRIDIVPVADIQS